ncbi:zinc ABC transporter substrate-binding protein [Benzoatithermus flavus]|uniref:High-affinity zinc uptake system protein ZnuA n=1 Tax=Benzoatithermus flavus TaxID=3108223 RepID=A0ABU8XMU7_9PROT
MRARLVPTMLLGTLLAWGCPVGAAKAGQREAPKVVATILPIHALVATVMQGAGEPVLLVHGNVSPHDYQLKPSDARALQEADVVVRVGPRLEAFLERGLDGLARKARVVTLMEAPGVRLLPAREGGVWEPHEHEDAETAGHADHGEGMDPHIWLDPANAEAMVRAIAAVLGEVDLERAALYATNAERATGELAALDQELRSALAPVRGKPFIVFHDAYQYLERAYDLTAAGSITVSPDQPPGARRLAELRRKIEESGAVCVFGEARTPSPLVATLAQGRNVGTGELDPEGIAGIDPGPEAYARLMRRNVDTLVRCLSAGS